MALLLAISYLAVRTVHDPTGYKLGTDDVVSFHDVHALGGDLDCHAACWGPSLGEMQD